jgi:hypothetical protein
VPLRRDAELVCHPGAPAGPVEAIRIFVERSAVGSLVARFSIAAPIERLRLPAPKFPAFADGLWRHTCCELFLARESGTAGEARQAFAYHELNFSPSGEWAGYAFASYRELAEPVEHALAPRIAVQRSRDALELCAEIELDRLAASLVAEPLRLAVSAVIEDQAGRLSYWALCHPAAKPDFHHPGSFALRVERPAARC